MILILNAIFFLKKVRHTARLKLLLFCYTKKGIPFIPWILQEKGVIGSNCRRFLQKSYAWVGMCQKENTPSCVVCCCCIHEEWNFFLIYFACENHGQVKYFAKNSDQFLYLVKITLVMIRVQKLFSLQFHHIWPWLRDHPGRKNRILNHQPALSTVNKKHC